MKLTCPSQNRLREYLEGSVNETDSEKILDHIEGCSSCDHVLATMESEQNDVMNEVCEFVRTESLLQEPEFEQLRNTARLSQADTTAVSEVGEPLVTGDRLRDYRLVKKIGEGGMGTVYQAFHVHLAKHVALKILPSDKLRSKQSVARFRQEMRAVGQVNHPNVVSASDAGTIDGQHFLVMELVQGADLARIIHDRGPLNVADACEIVRQAAIGLQHAHDNGLVHRDVKPSNIMLAIDGSVKLLDLGLAGLNNSEFESTANVVVTDRLTSVGQIMGTLDYMAPEQIEASPEVDGKADIYALGATLFQLLTGRTPCGDRSEGTPERIQAVLHNPPIDIATLRNDVPEELRALLLKMLAKNPEDRPQSAMDVAGELVQFTSDADLDALAEACRTSLDMPSADVDVTDDVSFVVSRAESQAHVPARSPFAAVALAGLFLALLSATVYYIVTNNGVVQIEVFDTSIKVAIDDQTVTFNEGNNKPIKLWPGEHKLVVSVGETELITDNFEIRRNDKIAFKVKLLEGEVVVSMGEKKHRSAALSDVRTGDEEPKADRSQLTENKLRSTQFSAVALVDGCEVSGRFMAEQAEVCVHNPTKEPHDISFHCQIVYQNSRMPDDIARLTAGEFHATVQPNESALKRFDDLVDASAGVPTNNLKNLLVMRVFHKPIKSTGDYPILPDEKLDLSMQPVTIASWPAATTELSKSKRTARLRNGREGITAIGTTGSHVRVSGSFTKDQACFWVVNPQGANRKDRLHYQVILRDSNSPEDIILLKAGELQVESEYCSKHVRRIDLRSDPDASVPIDHGKDTIELRVSQKPLDLKYIPITPEEEKYILRKAVTIASWPIQLVAVNTKGRLAFVRERELKGLADRVAKVEWSDDGKTVCAVDGTGKLRVWDAATGEQLGAQNLGLKMSWRPMAFSSDLKLIAIGLDEQVSIRRVVDNVEVTRISQPLDPKRKSKFLPELGALAFSPDGKRLVVGSSWVSVWGVESGDLIFKSRKLKTTTCAVTWSRDGGKYAAHTAGYELYSRVDPAEICVWDNGSGKELNSFTIRPHGQYGYDFGMWVATDYIAFSPDGQRIAVGSGTRGARDQEPYESKKCFVQVWDLKSGKSTRVVPEFSMAVGSLRFSSDGSLLAMHSDDKVRFWETESGQALTTLKPVAKIISFNFHPRENVVVTGHIDGSVLVSRLKRAAGRDIAPDDNSQTDEGVSDAGMETNPREEVKPTIHMYFQEWEYIEGITSHESTVLGEGPLKVYTHLKPALNVSPEDVKTIQLSYYDELATVKVEFTEEATLKMASTLEEQQNRRRLLTALINRKENGHHAFIIDPKQGTYKTEFFFHDLKEAQRIVDAYSQDGKRAWTKSGKKSIDLHTFQEKMSVPTEGKTAFGGVQIYHAKAQLSKDTKTALVESGAILQMWNLETGQHTSLSEWGGQGGVVGFVPERNLAWHAKSGVEFWDLNKSARTKLVIPHSPGPAEGETIAPAISKDGKLLATRTDAGKFRLWNLETQKPLSPEIEAGTFLYRLTFSPDRNWLFTEDKSGWSIWDVATQKRVVGPLLNLSDVNTDIAVSPDSSRIATIEGKPAKYEIVVRVARGETWQEHKRIPLPNPVRQAAWIDARHLAVVVGFRNETYGLKVISSDELEVGDYGFLRTFDKVTVAPDRKHLVVSNYAAVTCWKLGRKEHLWKIGTSEAGRSHDVHCGKDWVLLHEKGETTGARPAIVRSLNNGNEIFRKEDVIATAVNGEHLCLVDAKGIEVWQANRLEQDASAQRVPGIERFEVGEIQRGPGPGEAAAID